MPEAIAATIEEALANDLGGDWCILSSSITEDGDVETTARLYFYGKVKVEGGCEHISDVIVQEVRVLRHELVLVLREEADRLEALNA